MEDVEDTGFFFFLTFYFDNRIYMHWVENNLWVAAFLLAGTVR